MSADTATRPRRLPDRFSDLQVYEEWIQWEDADRVRKHVAATVEEEALFYEAMLARSGEIWDHLAGVRLDSDISPEDEALLVLAIAFAEISDGVEYYAPHSTAAVDLPRFNAMHDPIFGWRQR